MLRLEIVGATALPIVNVTDLNEHHCFYWLDDHTIFYHIVDGPGMALGIIKGCLHQEQVTAISEVQPVQGISGVELPMIKRQRTDLGQESDKVTRDFADEEVDWVDESLSNSFNAEALSGQ
ncbi:TPA: hypothetical protein ACH3X1_001541 [Trebouxia sp. C0004]